MTPANRRLCSLVLAWLVISVLYSSAQPSKKQSADLAKFSPAQLMKCYDSPKDCGATDHWEISDEFARRLPSLPTETLIACFHNWKLCGSGESQASGWPISDELARRGDISPLLARYWREPKWTIRGGIEHVAYHFDSPEVTAFMKRVITQRMEDGEDLYWPVNYLAKKCDTAALRMLSSGRYRNQGSLQYETSVVLFGKCNYRPAIPYLVDAALYDFSLNIVGAAEESLRALYPDAPTKFGKLSEEQQYFCRRARRDGFRVKCDSPQRINHK